MKIIRRFKTVFRQEKGLTLMEIVVSLIAVSIIIIPVSQLINTTVVGYTDIREYNFAIESARIGLNIMMSEIRSIEDPTDIDGGSSTSITIDVPTSARDITYAFDADEQMVTRKESGLFTAAYPFIVFVRDFDIAFYDRDDIETTYNDPYLWRIGIEIEIGDDNAQYRLYDQVFPRQWLN